MSAVAGKPAPVPRSRAAEISLALTRMIKRPTVAFETEIEGTHLIVANLWLDDEHIVQAAVVDDGTTVPIALRLASLLEGAINDHEDNRTETTAE